MQPTDSYPGQYPNQTPGQYPSQPAGPYPSQTQGVYPVQTATYPAPTPSAATISPFQLRIYFTGFPYWAYILAFFGLVFLAGGGIFFGLIFLLVGGGWIALRYMLSIKDAVYDDWVASQLHVSKEYALQQLRLDPSQLMGEEAYVIRGFVTPSALSEEPYKSIYDPSEVRYRRGADGRYRFSVNTMTYFFPLENELASFTGAVSALNQDARQEVGVTYFYNDIVGIGTERRQNRIKLTFASLSQLLVEPAANIAVSLLVFPVPVSLGLIVIAARLGGGLVIAFAALAGLVLAIYPLIVIGVLIWFFFFRQRSQQSQAFAVEVNSGSTVGAVVGFISPPRRSFFGNGTSGQEIVTSFDPSFPQTVERIRFLLRSVKQAKR